MRRSASATRAGSASRWNRAAGHHLHAAREILAEGLGPRLGLGVRRDVVQGLERIDADDAEDAPGHLEGGFHGDGPAEGVPEKDDLSRLFRFDDGADVGPERGESPVGPHRPGFAVPRKVQGDHPVLSGEGLELGVPEAPVGQPAVDENERRFAGSGGGIDDLDAVGGPTGMSFDQLRSSRPPRKRRLSSPR